MSSYESGESAAPNSFTANLKITADTNLGKIGVHNNGVVAGAVLPTATNFRCTLLTLSENFGGLRSIVRQRIIF